MRTRFSQYIHVALDSLRPKDPPISLAAASILATFKDQRIDASLKSLNYNVNGSLLHAPLASKVTADIMDQNPSRSTLVGFGAYVWNQPVLRAILTSLRTRRFPGRVVLGGPQISYTKSDLGALYPEADVFVRGYAEQAVCRLLREGAPTPIKGVSYKGIPDLPSQASCPFETLPSPFFTGLISPQPFLRWETQRGCPFQCSFCQHRESSLDGNRRRRVFGTSRIHSEIDWLTAPPPSRRSPPLVDDIAVLDPTFNSGRNYLRVLEHFLAKEYRGKLSLQCRAEMVNDDMVQLLVELKRVGPTVQCEFGVQTVVKKEAKIIQRMNNLTKIEAIFERMNELDLPYEVSLIYGLPEQTVESFRTSVDWCLDRNVPVVKAWPLMLLRGTELDEPHVRAKYALQESCIGPEDDRLDRIQQGIPHVTASSSFTFEEWIEMTQIAAQLNERSSKSELLPRSQIASQHMQK